MSDTSVRREVTVGVRPAEAFEVFTVRFDAVKPPEHNLLGVPGVESVLEPRVGGALVDRAPDGRECRWGRVLAFEPPHRLVFSWEIGPDWQLVTDPATASEVEVRFEAVDAGTRVVLEHRHLDRHGPGWESMVLAIGNDNGWPLYLRRLADAAHAAVTADR